MRADYDLVVIGDSFSGRWAALAAARQYARVAYLPHYKSVLFAQSLVCQDLATLVTTALIQGLPLPFETVASLQDWMVGRAQTYSQSYSLERLAFHGVDILTVPGYFDADLRQTSHPGFVSGERQLQSRYYLLVPEAPREVSEPHRSKFQEIRLLDDFLSRLQDITLEQKIYIRGCYPWAILLGQILNRLGYAITIWTDGPLLPKEDADLSFLLQSQLEAEGITCHCNQVFFSPSQSAIVFDPVAHLSLEDLRLQHLGVEPLAIADGNAPQLSVNSTFLTHCSRLYACGSAILGGYDNSRIAHYDVSIALENILFQASTSPHYHGLAYGLPLAPGLTRVGLTESQARQRFDRVQVMTRAMESSSSNGIDILFCKLIAKETGEIVGIHGMGDVPIDSLALFEQIIRERCRITELSQRPFPSLRLQDIFHDFAHRWDVVQQPRKRDRLEQYFRAKRKQFS